MLDDSTVERRLSPSEKWLWIIDHESRINFTMHAHVTGAIDEDVLRLTLGVFQYILHAV